MLFSDHTGSLLRRQPGGCQVCTQWATCHAVPVSNILASHVSLFLLSYCLFCNHGLMFVLLSLTACSQARYELQNTRVLSGLILYMDRVAFSQRCLHVCCWDPSHQVAIPASDAHKLLPGLHIQLGRCTADYACFPCHQFQYNCSDSCVA